MHVFVMLITIFFATASYNPAHGPQSASVFEPSLVECQAAAVKVKAQIEADDTVRVANIVCIDIDASGNKT